MKYKLILNEFEFKRPFTRQIKVIGGHDSVWQNFQNADLFFPVKLKLIINVLGAGDEANGVRCSRKGHLDGLLWR